MKIKYLLFPKRFQLTFNPSIDKRRETSLRSTSIAIKQTAIFQEILIPILLEKVQPHLLFPQNTRFVVYQFHVISLPLNRLVGIIEFPIGKPTFGESWNDVEMVALRIGDGEGWILSLNKVVGRVKSHGGGFLPTTHKSAQ